MWLFGQYALILTSDVPCLLYWRLIVVIIPTHRWFFIYSIETTKELAEKALKEGNGVFRLIPNWVPRSFCRPGRRIKLHPDDYYALGLERGAIDERWFASTTHAENGPGTPDDEGLSYIAIDEEGKERILLRDAVAELGAKVVGESIWNKYHRWPAYSKFFDNLGPLPHHIHHNDEMAALTGQKGKRSEMFISSLPSINNYSGRMRIYLFRIES